MKKIALLFCLLLSPGCSGVSYLAENGIGQWKLFNKARPVSDVLASPRTEDKVRTAILTVQEAKKFATSLGLKATGSYQSFVQLDSPCLLWAISAANPILLEEKTWKFPIVGEVPYLGFFQEASAKREIERIAREERFDTWIRCVPAFSSLGWFPDPLYSSMLKGHERDVAELVIHESLHATVWVGNSVEFNEKLANFVGLEGSLRYVEQKGGARALAEAKREVLGEKIFGDFIFQEVELHKRRVQSLSEKERFFKEQKERYQNFLAEQRKLGKDFIAVEPKFNGWNNAALLTYANYYSDVSTFETMLARCGKDVGRFVNWIYQEQKKGAGRFLSAPEEHLVELVKGSSCPVRPGQD